MRRATVAFLQSAWMVRISIHALHEESDQVMLTSRACVVYFNPRSP